jgi:hypothetical protein
MVELIPSQDAVMQILKRTGAFREGHFVYPTESTRRTTFRCHSPFVITTRRVSLRWR